MKFRHFWRPWKNAFGHYVEKSNIAPSPCKGSFRHPCVINATYIAYMSLYKDATLGLPQQGVRLLADSNTWNMNGTPNLRTVRQMLKNNDLADI